MIRFLLVLMLGTSFHLNAQRLGEVGIDDDPTLTYDEASILNSMFSETLDGYDFSGKRIAYYTGSSASKHQSKSEFFETIGPYLRLETEHKPPVVLVEFSADERAESGGYDAVLLSYVKVMTDARKARIIEELVNLE